MTPEWQRQLMALMKECRALGFQQSYRWAALRHGVSEHETQSVLVRLRTRGILAMDSEHVMLPYRKPSQKLMAAFDALLQLAGKTAENITAGQPPVLLRFSAGEGDDILLFSIAWAESGNEEHISGLLQEDSGPNHRWIVLLDSIDQRSLLTQTQECYFALLEESNEAKPGLFRFFT